MIRSSLALALNPGCRNAVDGDQRQAGWWGWAGNRPSWEALEARLALVGLWALLGCCRPPAHPCLFPKR